MVRIEAKTAQSVAHSHPYELSQPHKPHASTALSEALVSTYPQPESAGKRSLARRCNAHAHSVRYLVKGQVQADGLAKNTRNAASQHCAFNVACPLQQKRPHRGVHTGTPCRPETSRRTLATAKKMRIDASAAALALTRFFAASLACGTGCQINVSTDAGATARENKTAKRDKRPRVYENKGLRERRKGKIEANQRGSTPNSKNK